MTTGDLINTEGVVIRPVGGDGGLICVVDGDLISTESPVVRPPEGEGGLVCGTDGDGGLDVGFIDSEMNGRQRSTYPNTVPVRVIIS